MRKLNEKSNRFDNKKKGIPAWIVVSLISSWVVVTLLGLWWFQSNQIKSFIDAADDIAYYQPLSIDKIFKPYLESAGEALPNQKTLLHFWKPDCLCNRVSQRHFSDLASEFNNEQLRIIVIAHPSTSDKALADLIELNGDRLVVLRADASLLNLPSSPSLAIYDDLGQFSYFGAYGFGAFCTVRDDDFLSTLIKKAPSSNNGQVFTNVIGDGCFCSWND